MPILEKNILILCKTYPSPSGKYSETSCVAGMDENGQLIRLFPVPFRLITKDAQFKKWQWIKVKIEKATKDRRPESYSIKVDTIETGQPINTDHEWRERRRHLDKLETFTNFDDIQSSRSSSGTSLALLKPASVAKLDIVPVSSPDWTKDEMAKLEQEQRQGGLFDTDDKPSIRILRKLPYDFYYQYKCETSEGEKQFRHKIVDWEIGALYWQCIADYGSNWEEKFRHKMEINLPSKDLMFLMGNIHRFQDQWLIISLIYPPIRIQGTLF